jgi:hypothetical protein
MNDDGYEGNNTNHMPMSIDDDDGGSGGRSDNESIILSFCDITGCDVDSAQHFLEVSHTLYQQK